MKITNISITGRFERLIQLIEISKTIVSQSKLINNEEKKIYLDTYEANLEDVKYYFDIKKQNALKQIENEVLTPWEESMDEDSIKFWSLIKEKGIPLQQENKIEKILKRGSIRNYGEFEFILDAIVIYQQEGQISQDDVNRLNQMIGDFEQKRKT